MEIATVAVHSEDDATSLHTRRADESYALKGRGVAAYLDAAGLIEAAAETGCDAVHPATGSWRRMQPSRLCAAAGLIFVGPSPEIAGPVRRQGGGAGVRRTLRCAAGAG